MDSKLTYDKARAQVYTYLQRSVDALPKGPSLGLQPDPGTQRQALSPGGMLGCSDQPGASSKNTPGSYQVSYWVNGVPNGQQGEYTKKLVATWTKWGWTQKKRFDPKMTVFDSPDGYTISVTNADNGPGGVSLSATSPCFMDKNGDQQGHDYDEHQPSVIKQK